MKRDEATVSYTMSRIRGKDTSIEVKLRKALYEKGCRYRCNSKYIFGHPDISFKGVKVVVFCDSEFWHGKDFEENEKKILSNREYWIPKIKRNIERDNEVNEKLTQEGYLIFRFWGGEIQKNLDKCVTKILEGLSSRGYKFAK
ncbi:MAG: very short patch repair endonuclease [Bacilli bacterium]|jgi:DNA mismatch endonuclease (patch repair protein)|nr:very short patch repair endonuclease [Bacilli bacterium]